MIWFFKSGFSGIEGNSNLDFFGILHIVNIRFVSGVFSRFFGGDPSLLKNPGFFLGHMPFEIENDDKTSQVSNQGNESEG